MELAADGRLLDPVFTPSSFGEKKIFVGLNHLNLKLLEAIFTAIGILFTSKDELKIDLIISYMFIKLIGIFKNKNNQLYVP